MQKSERPDFNQMITVTLGLVAKYGITFDNGCRILVDGDINCANTSTLPL
jgi:hypothetical protein